MRGRPNPQRSLLAIVDLEERIPRDPPLRRIKEVTAAALSRLSPVFDALYARGGRALFDEVVWAAAEEGRRSDEPFRVDGTLLEAAARLKRFRSQAGPPPPVDDDPGHPSVDFRGARRCHETHARTTDPEARRLRKGPGKEARRAFRGPALRENRNGLRMDFIVSQATGTAARAAVPELWDGVRERGYRPCTLGADRGDDTQDGVGDLRARRVTPQVAPKKKHAALDGRTTRPAGYAVSLRIRQRGEEVFGWRKTVGGFRRTRDRGVERTGLASDLVATAYHRVRLAKRLDAPEAATGPSA